MIGLIGNGKLAKAIMKHPGYIILDVDLLKDIVIPDDVELVINLGAITNRLECEQNRILAYNTNTFALERLSKIKQPIIHISCADIFEGERLHSENSTDFFNIGTYSISKRFAEKSALKTGRKDILIARISTILTEEYIEAFEKKTYVSQFIKRNYTFVDDLVELLEHAIKNKIYGIYNLASEGVLSEKDLLDIIYPNKFISGGNLAGEIYIPNNSGLDVSKAKKFGFPIKSVLDSVARYKNALQQSTI